jgi:hypothetical protein
MRIPELKKLAAVCFTAMTPLMVWGDPGIGKSSSLKQLADELGIGFIDLRLSLLEQIDLRGLPMPDAKSGSVKWLVPSFLPKSGRGIIMLDEIVQASPSMQAAASQLILDRRIGEYVLPDGWIVIAAGNYKTNRAATNAMPTHIANRFIHAHLVVCVDSWVTWALGADLDPRVIAYIKWRPQHLHRFDPMAKGEAFASPRSWEFVSKILLAGLPPELLKDAIVGCVGEGIGTEFVGFLSVCDRLPSLDAIKASPATAPLPDDLATSWAIASNLIYVATKDNVAKVATYLRRLIDTGRPELSVYAHKELGLKKPELCNTRAYIEWATANAPFIA